MSRMNKSLARMLFTAKLALATLSACVRGDEAASTSAPVRRQRADVRPSFLDCVALI